MFTKQTIKTIVQSIENTKALIEAGEFEFARAEIEDVWKGPGEYPETDGLPSETKADLLLVCGILTGWFGSINQTEGLQESSKNIISKASFIYETENNLLKWADSRSELALCHWREGSYSEARIVLQDALDKIPQDTPSQTKTRLLLRLVNVEISTHNYKVAHTLIHQAIKTISQTTPDLLCGKIYFHYALIARRLAREEEKDNYFLKAIKYYEKARDYYKSANHKLYEVMVDNNLAYLLCELGEFEKAHQNADKALDYFETIEDKSRTALAYDNKARIYLAEHNLPKAEQLARQAISLVENGDELSSLSEYQITLGIIQTNKNELAKAEKTFLKAFEIANQIGDYETGGTALLTLIETLDNHIPRSKLITYYLKADEILSGSNRKTIIQRLKNIAVSFLSERKTAKTSAEDNRTEIFVGKSAELKNVISLAKKLAENNSAVLITGESGTGKSTLARQIHRWRNPVEEFIFIDCNLYSDNRSDNGLFSRFTREHIALKSAKSFLGSTLFLKEIGKLDSAEQAGLYAFLQQQNSNSIKLIASTSENLEKLVKKNRFRIDLYHLLGTFEIKIPALRHRKEDIEYLGNHFLRNKSNETFTKIDKQFYLKIENKPLYGNCHELNSVLTKAVWNIENDLPVELPENVYLKETKKNTLPDSWEQFSLPDAVNEFESEIIFKALKDSKGKITKAAELLNISHQNLSSILKQRHKALAPKTKRRKRRSIVKKK